MPLIIISRRQPPNTIYVDRGAIYANTYPPGLTGWPVTFAARFKHRVHNSNAAYFLGVSCRESGTNGGRAIAYVNSQIAVLTTVTPPNSTAQTSSTGSVLYRPTPWVAVAGSIVSNTSRSSRMDLQNSSSTVASRAFPTPAGNQYTAIGALPPWANSATWTSFNLSAYISDPAIWSSISDENWRRYMAGEDPKNISPSTLLAYFDFRRMVMICPGYGEYPLYIEKGTVSSTTGLVYLSDLEYDRNLAQPYQPIYVPPSASFVLPRAGARQQHLLIR